MLNTIKARPAADGDGVRIQRVVDGRNMQRMDPFLLLDEFNSNQGSDYIGGFPPHPHRGFSTITYMLNGRMQHQDSLGNQGVISGGGVQWMKAARGVIHSEMPQQTEGLMRGFQLWLNLPASEKMSAPDYRDIQADEIPVVTEMGLTARIIAGDWPNSGVRGPLTPQQADLVYWDLHLDEGTAWKLPIEAGKRYYVYLYEGAVTLNDSAPVAAQHLVLLDDASVVVQANTNSRFLVLAGIALQEPIAHYGPFVMNSSEEIEQALQDYRDGRLVTEDPI